MIHTKSTIFGGMQQPPKRGPGVPPSTTIWTEGVDPMVVKLRTEQVRQGLSDYKLAQLAPGTSPMRLGKMWRGTAPSLKVVRSVLAALRIGNPAFTLIDP